MCSVDDAEAARGHRRLGLRELDDELGAMRREDVLADEDRLPAPIGGHPLAAQHGRADRHAEQAGVDRADEVGADGLGGAAQFDVEQLVERAPLDVLAREVGTEPAPGTTR